MKLLRNLNYFLKNHNNLANNITVNFMVGIKI